MGRTMYRIQLLFFALVCGLYSVNCQYYNNNRFGGGGSLLGSGYYGTGGYSSLYNGVFNGLYGIGGGLTTGLYGGHGPFGNYGFGALGGLGGYGGYDGLGGYGGYGGLYGNSGSLYNPLSVYGNGVYIG
ncbi:hypothetical protein RvY_13692 [Ramazzottius varieornatus]|uniref:Uncharacterized protein n=1 Tax=Ramazzottius varieornatus TaxID=947166 RepID=A0A1D1VNS2_RAMVA|nr:hypothetical protein RvY_13692 [Ramazzottius varieornatus]